MGRVAIDLELLTDATSFHIILDKRAHSRPPIMFFDAIECLQFSRVSCCRGIMEFLGYLHAKFLVLWDVVSSFVEQDVLVVEEFGCPVAKVVM